MVRKGKVSSVVADGERVTVTRYTGETVTPELVVPYYLFGLLSVGDPVIYTLFEDNTGIILHKEDGAGNIGITAAIVDGVLKVTASVGGNDVNKNSLGGGT